MYDTLKEKQLDDDIERDNEKSAIARQTIKRPDRKEVLEANEKNCVALIEADKEIKKMLRSK